MTDDLLYQLDGKMQLVKDDFYLLKKSRDCIDEQKKRIERLETALRIICDGPRDADKSYPELLAEVRCEARAALEKK